MSRSLDRFAAWLCLGLLLLTGLVPAHGFVVCIEDDGCVSIEVKTANANCGGCEGHEERDRPLEVALTGSSEEACPCLDIAVPGASDEQIAKERAFDVSVGSSVAAPASLRIEHATPLVLPARGPPSCPPRVADSLAHIRSVILLV